MGRTMSPQKLAGSWRRHPTAAWMVKSSLPGHGPPCLAWRLPDVSCRGQSWPSSPGLRRAPVSARLAGGVQGRHPPSSPSTDPPASAQPAGAASATVPAWPGTNVPRRAPKRALAPGLLCGLQMAQQLLGPPS